MSVLHVCHVPESNPAAFEIRAGSSSITDASGRELEPVSIPAPDDVRVVDDSDLTLARELRWYLEEYLSYPFSPNDTRAERSMDALKEWGTDAYRTLFDRDAKGILEALESGSLPEEGLQIEIESNDPRVLSWPWEALHHPTLGFLAHHTPITRRLSEAPTAHTVSRDLPKDRINILLVTSRPEGDEVEYRSVSRALVEYVANDDVSASIYVLRPPTLDQLKSHLEAHPNTYHILHFDGHGGYGGSVSLGSGEVLKGAKGTLLFEKEDGSKDEVAPETLSSILREHKIPVVVLNACQSAMVDERAEGPFASVAAGFLQAGVRSVVAMGYALYVSGARHLLPAFYERLFKTGDVAEAVRIGRQKMEMEKKRLSAAGDVELNDWLVPVHYHQADVRFSFDEAGTSDVPGGESPMSLPPEAQDATTTEYGFYGRDRAIHEIERTMRRRRAGILIHGLGGVGKTSLAGELLTWLKETGGLQHAPIWIDFREIRSAEQVLDRIGVRLFGDRFLTILPGNEVTGAEARREAQIQMKMDTALHALSENEILLVWDNFESASGIEGTSIQPLLHEEDRSVLRDLLRKLKGQKSKVLITSRSLEAWLGANTQTTIPLGGLTGEDRWALTRAILFELRKSTLQKDEALRDLVDDLGGHPLAMQAILPQVQSMPPQTLLDRFRTKVSSLDTGEANADHLFAALRFVEDSMPEDLRELLKPLSLHERFVDADYLAVMCEIHGDGYGENDVERLMSVLSTAGLLLPVGQNRFRIHPMLTSFLRETLMTRRNGWLPSYASWVHTPTILHLAHLMNSAVRLPSTKATSTTHSI